MRSITRPARRADAVANRDALLTAAARLYGTHGLDVPYDDIAREAGVGRATLYRHFPTREELLVGILERLVDELEAAAAERADGRPEFFFVLFELALKHQKRNLPLIDLLPNRRELPAQIQGLRTRVEALFEQPLREAQQAGLARADLTPADVRTLLLMLTAVVRPGSARAEQQRAYELAQLVLRSTPPPG